MVNETLPARVDLEEIQSLAQLMIQSKMFSDIQGVAQGAVRILAGRELGIGPVASLRSIEIVRGNLSIRSHLMAAMIKRSSRYNYRVTTSTDDKCIIEFLEHGDACGTSEFTLDDAKRAGIATGDSWKKYPKTMLYNRAMSQGARMYCPDIFLGGVFYENEIIEADATLTSNEPEPMPIEQASDRQKSFLLSLLKAAGVLEGDKRKLLDFAYGDHLTKQAATELIEFIKEQKTLPGDIRKAYIKMLVQEHGHDRKLVAEHMDKTYGHHDPAKLNNAQFTLFVEHMSGLDTPVANEEEPDDIYLPGELVSETTKDVAVQDWLDLNKELFDNHQITANQFQAWALAQFGGGTVKELIKLPREVYYSLKSMGIDDIASQVREHHAVDSGQGVLVS